MTAEKNETELPPDARCADCGTPECVDTWVVIEDETGAATEEPVCQRCLTRRELIYFGPGLSRDWTH